MSTNVDTERRPSALRNDAGFIAIVALVLLILTALLPFVAGGFGGTGLGLAIVAALIAVHSGTVSVFVTPGGGATFQVRLPLTAGSQAALSASQAPVGKLKA